jgi:hypothetical protein
MEQTHIGMAFVPSSNKTEAVNSLKLEYGLDEKHKRLLHDGWAAREELLARSPQEFFSFVGLYGQFNFGAWDIGSGIFCRRDKDSRTALVHAFDLLEKEVAEWQLLIRDALQTPHAQWGQLAKRHRPGRVNHLTRPLPIKLEYRNGIPAGQIVCQNGVFGAIAASVQLDVLRGYNFKTCASCGASFRLESKHERIYCSYECAHLEAVRRSRSRKKNRE